MEYKVFIVEDDIQISKLIKEYLESYGYYVLVAQDFSKIAETFKDFSPHVVLIDINLPMYDGFYWCQKIRKYSKSPIIFISAREGNMDQVMAIESGGDDYIVKPFSCEVLMAKIKSQIRRSFGEYSLSDNDDIEKLYGLKYHKNRMEAEFKGEKVVLTKREGILLGELIKNYPNVSRRESLLSSIWDDGEFVEENTLNVNIKRVRKKLEMLGIENSIETVRGVGYRLNRTWE